MSKRNYMIFDLVLLTIIGSVIEGVLTYASNQVIFLMEGFTVSFVVLFALIGMFRWNWFGVIPGIGTAATQIFIQNQCNGAYQANPSMAAGILSGICATVFTCFLFRVIPKEKMKEKIGFLFLYSGVAFILYSLVYVSVWVIFGKVDFFFAFGKIIGWNLLNYVMASIVLLIANKQRYFLVDMNDYLLYLHNVPESARVREEIQEDKENSVMSEIADSDETNDIALLDGGTLSEEQLIELKKTFEEKEGEKKDGIGKSQ